MRERRNGTGFFPLTIGVLPAASLPKGGICAAPPEKTGNSGYISGFEASRAIDNFSQFLIY